MSETLYSDIWLLFLNSDLHGIFNTIDAPKDTTETSKAQNDSSARIVPQPNVTEKGQKPDSTDSTSTGKEQQSESKNQPAESNKGQNGQSSSEKPAAEKGMWSSLHVWYMYNIEPTWKLTSHTSRVVRKVWNRRLSCQSKWPVQGYNLKNAICKEMPTRVAGR